REYQFGFSNVFQVVHLRLAFPIALVPRLSGPIRVLDRRAVVQMLAAAAGRDRRPEIVEHVAVESDPLAGLQPDRPHPDAIALRQELRPDAAVRMPPLLFEFLRQPLRPSRALGPNGLLVRHGERHGMLRGRNERWQCITGDRLGKEADEPRGSRGEVKVSRRALVIGGSISGLFAALALLRRGWGVEIFERVEGELRGLG